MPWKFPDDLSLFSIQFREILNGLFRLITQAERLRRFPTVLLHPSTTSDLAKSLRVPVCFTWESLARRESQAMLVIVNYICRHLLSKD